MFKPDFVFTHKAVFHRNNRAEGVQGMLLDCTATQARISAVGTLHHRHSLCREMDPPPTRREALPTPKQKDDNSSIWSIMWSILKESLGKDLTHITLPFFFNEPLSVLQKTMEDLEYADLLNKVHRS